MAANDIVQSLVINQSTRGVAATGSVTMADAGDNGDTITIVDGQGNSVQFELDTADPPVAGTGDQAVLIGTLSTDTQAALMAAISNFTEVACAINNVAAEATVTFTTGAPTDGAIVTVTDYEGTAVTFEFSAAGDGSTGDVQVVKGATHLTAATAFEAAVNANAIKVTAADVGGVVTLTQDLACVEGQVSSDPAETVADANIAVAVWGNSSLADGQTGISFTNRVPGAAGNQTISETGDTFTVVGSLANGVDGVIDVGLKGHTQTGMELVVHKRADGQIDFTSNVDGVRVITHEEQVRRLFDELVDVATRDFS